MELEALINLAWLLVGGGSFFVAMRYTAGRRGSLPENLDTASNDDNAASQLSCLAATAVRDPVCGMVVEPSDNISWIHNGRTYYFCSMSCRGRFRAAPKKFLGPRRLASDRHV